MNYEVLSKGCINRMTKMGIYGSQRLAVMAIALQGETTEQRNIL